MARASFKPSGHRGSSGTSRRCCFLSLDGSTTSGSAICESVGASSAKPSRHRSTPTHATITPLSVHHLCGGVTSGTPASLATDARVFRTTSFAATPPATTRHEISGCDSDCDRDSACSRKLSRAHPTARRVRSSRCVTAANWNDAAMSAFIWFLSANSSGENGFVSIVSREASCSRSVSVSANPPPEPY